MRGTEIVPSLRARGGSANRRDPLSLEGMFAEPWPDEGFLIAPTSETHHASDQ